MDSLGKSREAARSEFSQAARTKGAYDGYLTRARAFLGDVVEERRENLKKDRNWICPDGIETDVLSKAFDKPNKHSAYALELYLVQTCIVEGHGKSACEGIHGAFAKHWDTMDGDKYSGLYSFDEATGVVTGCPARAQAILSFIKVIKTKSNVKGAAATRHHAEAMTIQDMQKWMNWSESECPVSKSDKVSTDGSERLVVIKHTMMRAFGSSGFILWTRNFELCALQMRDLTLDCVGPAPFNLPFFEVFLDARKGWQNKQGFDDGSRETSWNQLYRALIGRELQPEDYVFPHVSANGTIDPRREMTLQGIQDLITEFTKGAGLSKIYTTHCFRRGGAQYRFMFAPLGKRWAAGEQVDTLMRYLMDSLQSYETGQGDALCPIPKEAEKSFMGEHLLVKPVVTEEFRLVTSQILKKLGDINLGNNSQAINPSVVAGSQPSDSIPASGCIPAAPSSSRGVITLGDSHPSSTHPVENDTAPQEQSPPLGKRVSIIPGVFIPDLKKGDFAWRDAVRQWEEGVPDKNVTPLRDWPKEWYTDGMRLVTGAKRSQRKLIAEEYYRLGSNDQTFIDTYPEASRRIGSIIKAIQESNKLLGIGQSRRSRRGISDDSD
ncbi:hypothetical protein B0H11DRAFT_2155556 [Mycena galericulata]|nr:hypothetical protein B0H11DRAFT_2155556 [Mycena galericulata]